LTEKPTKYLLCACCGSGFYGWQHHDRDTGYGICNDKFCADSYGYTTWVSDFFTNFPEGPMATKTENQFGYYLFLKPGCKREEIELVPLKEKFVSTQDWSNCLREDLTLAILYFGTKSQFEIVFDDNGRISDKPEVSTVELNRHLICGPAAIFKLDRSNQEEGPQQVGLTKKEADMIIGKLHLLEGAKIPALGEMVVHGFDKGTDLFKAMSERSRFAAKENADNWGEA
jgi:hypothetical protein